MNRPQRTMGVVDMTSMVDVTFLLLVFFMVTAAFSLQRSIEFPLHDEGPADKALEPDQEVALVTVTIDQFNTYRVSTPVWEEEAASEHDLHVTLQAARQGSEQGPTALLVRASGEALHEKVVAALDAGMRVGMHELRLETFEDE